jgi:hypothetical protein
MCRTNGQGAEAEAKDKEGDEVITAYPKIETVIHSDIRMKALQHLNRRPSRS